MRANVFVVLVLSCVVGCGTQPTNSSAAGSGKPALPIRLEADGWYLNVDCTLNLGGSPYTKDVEAGKNLYARSVTVTPVGGAGAAYHIRTTDDSLKDSVWNSFSRTAVSRPVVKLHAEAIPLPQSMAMASDGQVILAGGEEGRTLGGDVVSKVVKGDTKIMPRQVVEVVDSQGAVVLHGKPKE